MNKKIITISREFGSGGRSIAKMVADRLGVPYYDKELIKQVAAKTGFDPAYIEEAGEYSQGKTLLSYLSPSNGPKDVMNGMSAADFLWVMQRQVILEIAEKGPCVIVGRCADYILKDRSDCLNVFIHAGKAFRAERIVRLYGSSEQTPEQRLDNKDGRRRVNYSHYTNREWGKCQNYTLSLDSGEIGMDRCVDIIAGLCQEREHVEDGEQ